MIDLCLLAVVLAFYLDAMHMIS